MAPISVCSDFKTHLNINTVIFHYYLICNYTVKEHLFYIGSEIFFFRNKTTKYFLKSELFLFNIGHQQVVRARGRILKLNISPVTTCWTLKPIVLAAAVTTNEHVQLPRQDPPLLL